MKGRLLFILFIASCVFAQDSRERILAYDDGNPNVKLTFMENGTFFITRFSTGDTTVLLTKLVFFTPDTSQGASFLFTIYKGGYNEPGSSLLSSIPMAANKIGWNELDISQFNVNVNGDFYYQLSYDLSSKFSISAENREPITRRTWDTDC